MTKSETFKITEKIDWDKFPNWYKKNEGDTVSWSREVDSEGLNRFSFDGETMYSLIAYPEHLTDEQRAIFEKENSDWLIYNGFELIDGKWVQMRYKKILENTDWTEGQQALIERLQESEMPESNICRVLLNTHGERDACLIHAFLNTAELNGDTITNEQIITLSNRIDKEPEKFEDIELDYHEDEEDE